MSKIYEEYVAHLRPVGALEGTDSLSKRLSVALQRE
jgi:hypothetical protein